jgi:hypothetical protein
MAPIFVLLCIIGASDLSAHQKKEAITRVIFNQRTESIEVIHRFLIHDAEHASKVLFGKKSDIIGDEKSQQQFSNYVIEQFRIEQFSGKQISLKTVGFEVEGKYIWVYQEANLEKSKLSKAIEFPNALAITHNALREIWPSQTNLVNIEYGKKVRSLVFNGATNAKSIKLD